MRAASVGFDILQEFHDVTAIEQLRQDLQWIHSYVAGDKTFCIYLAKDRATINKHAELSGIPVSSVTEITQIIDPLTANN